MGKAGLAHAASGFKLRKTEKMFNFELFLARGIDNEGKRLECSGLRKTTLTGCATCWKKLITHST
jgi:hypothetical protein